MALIGANGMRTATGPNRMFSGVTSVAGGHRRENIAIAGSLLNFSAGEARVSGVTDRASIPVGSLHPVAWVPPRKSGGLASRTRRIVGTGDMTAAGALGRNMDAGLSGSGAVSQAALGLILSAVAALAGNGSLTADVAGKLEAAATLAGEGDLTGSVGALAGLLATPAGTGAVSAAIAAKGSMAAEIVVTGTGLTTANVADAIWGAVIESGFTAEQVLRLIAAATAGKASGAEGTTIAFRDLGDTVSRIVATVDEDGNRTGITYNAG